MLQTRELLFMAFSGSFSGGRFASPLADAEKALEPLNGVAREQRELRFTRNAWALWLYFWGVYLVLGMAMAACMTFRPRIPFWVEAACWTGGILLAAVCFWLAVVCMRRAYVLLTPLGVEILPLWKPEKRMKVYPWYGIDDWSPRLGGIVLLMSDGSSDRINLFCMRARQRELLTTALTGRIMQKIHSNHDSPRSEQAAP